MKKTTILFLGAIAFSTVGLLLAENPSPKYQKRISHLDYVAAAGLNPIPHDQWLSIRSYPDGFDQAAYLNVMEGIRLEAQYTGDSREVELTLDWQEEGPGNIGGRFDVLTVSPTDQDIIYAGATNGGVFKTTNGGTTWNPIFDDQPYLAIGAITIDPENESILYVGTGDRNFTGTSFIGNGVYKSEDAGATWTEIGLIETGAVTEIIIDPGNSDRIFASTLGNPHIKTTERGIYRSDDGGTTWANKLFVSDSSGVIDLVMDPSNPEVLYAAGYNRMRNYFASTVSGPQARIYKTIDGGENWTELAGGLPLEDDCRIGLSISNEDPSMVYALYVDGSSLNVKDIFRTTDAGTTWSPLNVYGDPGALPDNVMGGFGWYFGEIYMNPYNNDHLIIPGVDLYQSFNAGETWEIGVPYWWTYEVHADKHAVSFLDEDSYILATDGGLYKTNNNGGSWSDIENIPITQLYHIDVHPQDHGIYGGGAQDNGSMSGNAASFNSWDRLYGGDGFRVTFLELDEGAAYYETQNGNLRYSDPGGAITNVSPYDFGMDRSNWDMPYFINEQTVELYAGTAHIQYMNGAPFGTYAYISDDLTRVGLGEPYDLARYHTITEIDQPRFDSDVLYVGTSDGLMWRGNRTGAEWDWTNITADLPNKYVTGVRCSPNTDGTVYVCFSGYKVDDNQAFVYKSEDFGETWVDISGDLPAITTNDILIVPGYENDEYLFAAMDGGVYFSENNGGNWNYLGVGLPFVTVSELHLDLENEKLIAGTFARSIWSYDVSWMEEVEEPDDTGISEEKNNQLFLYPNPVVDIVKFQAVDADIIHVFDQSGKLVIAQNIQHFSGYSQANFSVLTKGVYYVSAGQFVGKIIKQ